MNGLIHFLPFIPFSVFFVCCAAQFHVFGALGTALRERHPTEWANTKVSLLGGPLFGREWAFMVSGRHHELNDPNLTKRVRDARRLTAIAYCAWGLLVVCIFAIRP